MSRRHATVVLCSLLCVAVLSACAASRQEAPYGGAVPHGPARTTVASTGEAEDMPSRDDEKLDRSASVVRPMEQTPSPSKQPLQPQPAVDPAPVKQVADKVQTGDVKPIAPKDAPPEPLKVAEPVQVAEPMQLSPALPTVTEERHAEAPKEAPWAAPQDPQSNSEGYENYGVNPYLDPRQDPLSTFSIDVDTGSYTIARRKLREGGLPPAASVRVEEFVNYFDYSYPTPDGQVPFAVAMEAAPSPFERDTTLLRVGIQGQTIDQEDRKPIHLVFLVDTSGSMQSADKIGLLKKSLKLLVNNLQEDDTVAIATYAGWTEKVLEPTSAEDTGRIFDALDRLEANGSTAMSSGLQLAYDMAYEQLDDDSVTRVIVLSDGDANVGASSHDEILRQIGDRAREGVTLSTIGFGMGNYKDTTMEQLANKGDGNYYYIDTLEQAEKVFEEDLLGTLFVIAKDVKIQVEFDPKEVESYRLVGYENRDVADKDFRNDAVDAGEIGAGHRVTALYEVKLRPGASAPATVRIRHKAPTGGKATETSYSFSSRKMRSDFDESSPDFRLAVAAMSFAEILRGSPHAKDWSLREVRQIANRVADDEDSQELVDLIDRALQLGDEPRASR